MQADLFPSRRRAGSQHPWPVHLLDQLDHWRGRPEADALLAQRDVAIQPRLLTHDERVALGLRALDTIRRLRDRDAGLDGYGRPM